MVDTHTITELERLKSKISRVDASHFPIYDSDPYIAPHKGWFEHKYHQFCDLLGQIEANEGSLYEFSLGYKKYGFNEDESGVWYREWAPNAKEMYLIGDFNNWDRRSHKLTKNEFGTWEIYIPKNPDGSYPIPHNSKVKAHILNARDQWVDKIPAWITYATQDPGNVAYDGIYISQQEEHRYKWKHSQPKRVRAPRIYETHIGMSSSEPKIASYKEFTTNVLPRIKNLGYNVIQIMAIMEHSYYGSFGYHVTNFFAVSSRYGPINDLKELIDTAHSMGIQVLIDLVHSHASSNTQDGINEFDGTDYQYFHGGTKGHHALWDSKIFDYSKYEVLRFLLSNLAWYLEEYRFDGFRFDGITSLMYTHHGCGVGFAGTYNEYFGGSVDMNGMVYLSLANTLIHRINPNAITIAEDVSGMPGLGRTVEDGGSGFDYRLSMAIPDKWIKYLKEQKDEDWDMGGIVYTLTNRRHDEKCIGYAESHDQAIVGDKTLSMWLFDKEIYTNMSVFSGETCAVFRGISLHKMIRLITIALGGEGYLNFMGNEFGHPEWIDFPREGNGFSYTYCRRQWNLAEDHLLYFHFFNTFDKEMISLEEEYQWLSAKDDFVSLKHEEDKIISFEKGNLLWVFNFHSSKSYEHYRIGTRWAQEHIIVMDTDEARFGGKDRLKHGHENPFPFVQEPWYDRPNYIQLYIPSRTAIVLKAVKKE
jgi:1,4-alpha-glucan branching enzyme